MSAAAAVALAEGKRRSFLLPLKQTPPQHVSSSGEAVLACSSCCMSDETSQDGSQEQLLQTLLHLQSRSIGSAV